MAEKYIDLRAEIAESGATGAGFTAVCNVLHWLDEHPDQVPGRTITESELEHKCTTYGSAYETGFKQAGGRVIPAPEPTKVEHQKLDRDWWVENANVNDAEDCEACGEAEDMCPVHYGMAVGIEFVAKKIAALGDDPELFNSIPNPLKAPGGDDE